MELLTITDLKKDFDNIIASITKNPIFIKRNKKDYAVMLSYKEYEKLREFQEDQILGKKALKASKKRIGLLKSKKLTDEIMNAQC